MRAIPIAETLTEDLDRAISVLGALYRGRSPKSGQPLPPQLEYDDADVVFALGLALGALEAAQKARATTPVLSPSGESQERSSRDLSVTWRK